VSDLDFRALVEGSPAAIGVFDRKRRYVYANAALKQMLGLPEELRGQRADGPPPPAWTAAAESVFRTGQPREVGFTLELPTGARRLEAHFRLLPGELVSAAVRDITESQAGRLLATAANSEAKRSHDVALTAEQQARRSAEEARDRTRRLQALTEVLSGAVEREAVATIMVSAGRDAVGAAAGLAWLLRDEVTLELSAAEHGGQFAWLDHYRTIPMSTRLPICDAVRTGHALMFEDAGALTAQYPLGAPPPGSPFRAWAVMPIVVGPKAIGAVSFSFLSERTFSSEDRDLLGAMIGQASLALERCMLLDAERRARARERQLHVLAARLSSALTPERVAGIACEEAVSVLRAYSAAAAVRVGGEVHILGVGGPRDEGSLELVQRVPIDAVVPIAEAFRKSELVWCGSELELAKRYGHLESIWRKLGIRSWGAVPFKFEGCAVGSLAVSCSEERVLDDGEREFLYAVGQLAAQALERSRLYEALRSSDEQLRVALGAARAGTWRLDLASMTTIRDPSYAALVSQSQEHADADFAAVHPEDRPIAQAAFERSMREGVPYEPEVRVRRDDGSYLWVRAHGRVIFGEDGKPKALAGVIIDIDAAKRASLRSEVDRRITETLHRLGTSFASELDHDRLVHLIADEVTKLVGAAVGGFLAAPTRGASFSPHPIAATDAVRLDELLQPGATPLVAETLVEHRVVRLDDLFADARYAPGQSQPPDQGSTRSYLAVPVLSPSGELFGGLVFGHPEVARFSPEHERLTASIGRQAAVALENAKLYMTVREQKEQLELAVGRAHLADRRKDEFLAMLGHELRNPLAPIVTALALMDQKSDGTLENERHVIRRQVQHLTRLVDDLLDVSRITGGKIQLSRQVLEIGTVLTKAIETVSPLLEKRSQRLVLDIPRSGLLVDADATRLAQVIQNLLTNAAKYSDPDSTITVRAHVDKDRVIVDVQDAGIGIPSELMPRLFDLFVQGERTIDRSQGGLGIGLTIAKRLCELHGGAIWAASEGLGRGSTFSISLPRAAQLSAAQPSCAQVRMRPASRRKRVLVVDDNVDAAETLTEFLSALGYEAAVAHDGLVALDVAASFQPAVALLDIGLPVMDGYELARRLRQHGSAKLQLIAITGYGQDQDRSRALQAGFDHHLVKPIDVSALLRLLEA
jgi:signal transduction histidine kinase/PAS domain-containing protein